MRANGLTVRKFALYIMLSTFLFVISAALLFLMNNILGFSFVLSNFFADFAGLLITYAVSSEKIFAQKVNRHGVKAILFFSLRTLSILFFSLMAAYFYLAAIKIYNLIGISAVGSGPYFFTKALMIPFSLFVNFLISYFAIEWIERFLHPKQEWS